MRANAFPISKQTIQEAPDIVGGYRLDRISYLGLTELVGTDTATFILRTYGKDGDKIAAAKAKL